MVLLGLLLLAAGVATAIAVLAENTDQTSFDMFGQTVEDVTMGGLFLVGCAAGAATLLGLWLIAAGLKRARRRRVENRHVVTQTRTRADELEDENNELRARLDREDSARAMSRSSSGGYGQDLDSDLQRDRERDTEFTRDRDHDGVADRSETDTERTATMGAVSDDGGFRRDRDDVADRNAGGMTDRNAGGMTDRSAGGMTDRSGTSPYADRSVDTPVGGGAVYPADPGRDDAARDQTADEGRPHGLMGRDR